MADIQNAVLYKVRFDFNAQAPGQMSVREGDLLLVPLPWRWGGSPMVPTGWIQMIKKQQPGEEGLVPATFVEYFGEELEARPPTPPLPPQKSKLMGNRNLCHVKVCLIMD